MDIPFVGRVLLLMVVGGVLSWIDFRKHGDQATRGREYGFIFLAGFIGAILGGVNDAITSTISPEYFIFGKGLDEGNGLRLAAIRYGLQVGCSGGVVCGAALIYAGRRQSVSPSVEFGWLLRRLWLPIIGAVAGAVMIPLIASGFDPFHLAKQLDTVVVAGRIPKFLLVWWIHVGLYAGLSVGLLLLLGLVIRRRARWPSGGTS